MILFTPRLQKKFECINWGRRNANKIAKKHNSYALENLRIDLSKL